MPAQDRPSQSRPGPLDRIVAALRDPARFLHPVDRIETVETHVSWLILTGDYAYKLKKPVDLGFLDFSTLAARRRACAEEVRLNRRLAPDIYLEAVPLHGTPDDPRFDATAPVIEYAVKMRQFDQDGLLDRMLARGALAPAIVDAVASRVAAFHQGLAAAAAGSAWGEAHGVLVPALQNFEQMRPLVTDAAVQMELNELQRWTEAEFERRRTAFAARRQRGMIRECHGDLHLCNIVLIDGAVTPFDCIEFDPELRWIDVMSEIAFLVMDLIDRRRPDLGWRCLNAYLEHTGDYAGLAVLPFYLVYRALVRGKVTAIRLAQSAVTEQEQPRLERQLAGYLALAREFAHARRPALLITHGVTGSGKTTFTQTLLETLGTIRVRSDVERKRLHGLAAGERSGAGLGTGIYSAGETRRTYARLADLAREILAAGYPALVDATFLKREQRRPFADLGCKLGVPFAIADVRARPAELRARIARRAAEAHDASEADPAVLERQLAADNPPAADELDAVVIIEPALWTDAEKAAADVRRIADKLGLPLAP